MGREFEWDASKAKLNYLKHRVRFEEAVPVYRDATAKLFDDPEHPDTEDRMVLIGHTAIGSWSYHSRSGMGASG